MEDKRLNSAPLGEAIPEEELISCATELLEEFKEAFEELAK